MNKYQRIDLVNEWSNGWPGNEEILDMLVSATEDEARTIVMALSSIASNDAIAVVESYATTLFDVPYRHNCRLQNILVHKYAPEEMRSDDYANLGEKISSEIYNRLVERPMRVQLFDGYRVVGNFERASVSYVTDSGAKFAIVYPTELQKNQWVGLSKSGSSDIYGSYMNLEVLFSTLPSYPEGPNERFKWLSPEERLQTFVWALGQNSEHGGAGDNTSKVTNFFIVTKDGAKWTLDNLNEFVDFVGLEEMDAPNGKLYFKDGHLVGCPAPTAYKSGSSLLSDGPSWSSSGVLFHLGFLVGLGLFVAQETVEVFYGNKGYSRKYERVVLPHDLTVKEVPVEMDLLSQELEFVKIQQIKGRHVRVYETPSGVRVYDQREYTSGDDSLYKLYESVRDSTPRDHVHNFAVNQLRRSIESAPRTFMEAYKALTGKYYIPANVLFGEESSGQEKPSVRMRARYKNVKFYGPYHGRMDFPPAEYFVIE